MRTLTLRAARVNVKSGVSHSILAALVTISLQIVPLQLFAKGNGSSVGLVLTKPTGARPAALGEAFTAVPDDITSLGYNPASLATLSSGHSSFQYDKGMADDNYGQAMIGLPMKKSGLGLSIGYYNGGKMTVTETPGTERTVTAKSDLVASLGYAHKFQSLSLGVSGKYLSSTLVEKTGTAYAMDFGLLLPVSSKFQVGAAIQNFGTQLKYLNEANNLPAITRVGLMFSPRSNINVLVDAPYYMNEAELKPQLGLEYLVGPVALRGGYQTKNNLNQFTFGAGFILGKMSLDYAYGIVSDLDATHRASLSLRFGGEKDATVAQKPSEIQFMEQRTEVQQKSNQYKAAKVLGNQIYEVKPGDTLGSIARAMYGDSRAWRKIYAANTHLLTEGKSVEVGQRIVLP